MKRIIFYLFSMLAVISTLSLLPYLKEMPSWYLKNIMIVNCALTGAIGGLLYCIRAVYMNKCVKKNWDEDWAVWYFLRPFTSLISGAISFIFAKAGLLILDANVSDVGSIYGYLAIAFIAGYNVDNFLKKIEAIAKEVWSVEKSNVSKDI